MRMPTTGEYRYHAEVGRDYELKHLRERVKSLENGEALQHETERKNYWREKYEREHERFERYKVQATANKERELSKYKNTWQKELDEAEARVQKANEKLEAIEAERRAKCEENERLRELITDTYNATQALLDHFGLDHTKSGIPSSRDPLQYQIPAEIREVLAQAAAVANGGKGEASETTAAPEPKSAAASEAQASEGQESEGQESEDQESAGPETQKKRRHNYNSRKSSGKPRGAQPGHKHHPRKMLTPNRPPVIHDGRPAGTEGDDDWYMTDSYVERLEVQVQLKTSVTPHRAMMWRNRRTGEKLLSPMEKPLHDEINYGESVKALTLLIRGCGNVSIENTQMILKEASNGELCPSKGWISERWREMANKAKPELKEIFRTLLHSSYVGVDDTTTKKNGKRDAIVVATNGEAILFQHPEKAGKKAVDMLPCNPALGFDQTVVSDRASAYSKLGGTHQDCWAHHIRDLGRVAEKDPDSVWATELEEYIGMLIHERNEWWKANEMTQELAELMGDYGWLTPEQVEDCTKTYYEILGRARQHYIDNPPSKFWLFGYDLMTTLRERAEQALLFLTKQYVPPTNNGTEQGCKVYKRALHAAQTYRSDQSIDDHCDFLSVAQTAKRQGRSVYEVLKQIMGRDGVTRAH